MISFYSLCFLVAVIALGGWFLFQDRKRLGSALQTAVFAALGLYIVSVLMSSGAVAYKMSVVFRDFLAISVAGLVFLSMARLKKAFWIALVGLGLGLGLYYRLALQSTFPMATTIDQSIPLDKEGELLVELSEHTDLAALDALKEKYKLEIERAFQPADPTVTELDDYYVVNIPDQDSHLLTELEKALYETDLVDWVEPNEMISLDDPAPSKRLPDVNRKYKINDPGLEQMWAFDVMEVDKLYGFIRDNKIKPAKKALVAILDTGVERDHEDIDDNFRSVKKKYDDDPRGHGTHCAGIAGAVSNNGVGIASYAPDNGFIELTSIKVLGASGIGTQKSIINGMIEAADNGAAVISMSLGGRSTQATQRAYSKAVKYANKKGAIVVAAAGNSNRDSKDYAPVNTPGVIGASAINNDLNRAEFSNRVTNIDMAVAAPGVDIYSTIPGGGYGAYSGTSMATPYVAGLIGIMKSLKPSLTTKEAYQLLNKNGQKTNHTKETGKLIRPFETIKAMTGK